MSDQKTISELEFTVRCAYCRGIVPRDEVECMRCGAPLPDSSLGEVNEAEDFEDFLERIHEKLIKAGTSGAELAFGVGCTLEVLAVGLIMLVRGMPREGYQVRNTAGDRAFQ